MSADERLAQIGSALRRVNLRFLVMGGHAVRYYGVSRDTLDFDFHISLTRSEDLALRLRPAGLFQGNTPTEIAGWRGRDFRRFLLGRLPDGREEFLEFWLRNHLLAPFEDLYGRREEGEVRGCRLAFLSLPDLIHSKETERESDWQDVALLEEILDARNLAAANNLEGSIAALAGLRSRRGYRVAQERGLLADSKQVAVALARVAHPITYCFLSPSAPAPHASPFASVPEFIATPLHNVTAGSARHLALVEAMRRLYRQNAIAADRADKERFRNSD